MSEERIVGGGTRDHKRTSAPRSHAPPSAFLKIRELTKRFDNEPVVDGVSLDIQRSELFCLLGGSGSGKTTLLRMLAGFEKPDGGSIELDGMALGDLPPYRRPVNMMFQSYALFPHMSVSANIAYGLKREGRPPEEIGERVAEMLRLVQMEGYGTRKPHQLSGGQRQRVALARSLVKRPKLLLLDEPLSALDKNLRSQTQLELKRLQQQLGIAFIMVTHDQEEAMTLATRIGVMHRGRIQQVDTPQGIYEFPANRFVAEFVGTINVFDARVMNRSCGSVRIRLEREKIELDLANIAACEAGQHVWYGLRPEKLRLTLASEALKPEPNCKLASMDGTVTEVAYRGGNSIYRIELKPNRTGIIVTRSNASHATSENIAAGSSVVLSWDPNDGNLLTS